MSWGGRDYLKKQKRNQANWNPHVIFQYLSIRLVFLLSLITAKKLPKLNSPFLAAIDSTLDLCSEFAKAC